MSSSPPPQQHPPVERPPRNPEATRCSFWVEKRKRFCTFQLGKASASPYCSVHEAELARTQPASSAAQPPVSTRVPCPYGNHTVDASDLKRHMSVCPDRRFDVSAQPFFCKGLHERFCPKPPQEQEQEPPQRDGIAGSVAVPVRRDERVGDSRVSHRDLTAEQHLACWRRIVDVFREFALPCIDLDDPFVRAALHVETGAAVADGEASIATAAPTASATVGGKALTNSKNAVQHDGMIACLRAIGVIAPATAVATSAPPNVICELGAGRGQFSLAIADACVASNTTAVPAFLLVDRGGFRRKADARVAKESGGGGGDGDDDQHASAAGGYRAFQRIRVDMADFDLYRAPIEDEVMRRQAAGGGRVAAALVGKHLCGVCTDYAISSAFLSASSTAAVPLSSAAAASPACIQAVSHFAVAPCCHHRCTPAALEHLLGAAALALNQHDPASDGGGEDTKESTRNRARCLAMLETCLRKRLDATTLGAMMSMSSWATCGHEKHGDDLPKREEHDQHPGGIEPDSTTSDRRRRSRSAGELAEGVPSVTAAAAAVSSEKAIISVGELVSGAELVSAVPATKEGRERAGRMCKLIVDFMRGCALVAGSSTMTHFRMRPFLSPSDPATKENWMLLAF